MSLPSNFLGSTAVALQISSGDTRIFYQSADGSLHERRGVGPVVSGGRYVDKVLVPASNVRTNTPLAAITWDDTFNQIRFYYIGPDNHIHEICYPGGYAGALDGKNYMAAPNSGLLYAVCNYPDHPRLGFQSADAPAFITEAFYTPQTGWNGAKLI